MKNYFRGSSTEKLLRNIALLDPVLLGYEAASLDNGIRKIRKKLLPHLKGSKCPGRETCFLEKSEFLYPAM
jgi:hypothetical protein